MAMQLQLLCLMILASSLVLHAEYASDAEEVLLQRMLDEITQEYGMPQGNDASSANTDPDKLYRERKEGQISVYNFSPSIRDQEYLQHSSLWGYQNVAGGAGEGYQRLKPDGSGRNVQVVKSDAVLPAYCNPPNPCPIGYTAADGCMEEFENTAAFCREYQQQQDCMCDSEHMFDCPGSNKEDEVNTLAQQISNEGLMDSAINRIAHQMDDHSLPVEGQHKSLVAKKFFNKDTHKEYTRKLSEKNKQQEKVGRSRRSTHNEDARTQMRKLSHQRQTKNDTHKASKVNINPYLQGEKLPVVAKKG